MFASACLLGEHVYLADQRCNLCRNMLCIEANVLPSNSNNPLAKRAQGVEKGCRGLNLNALTRCILQQQQHTTMYSPALLFHGRNESNMIHQPHTIPDVGCLLRPVTEAKFPNFLRLHFLRLNRHPNEGNAICMSTSRLHDANLHSEPWGAKFGSNWLAFSIPRTTCYACVRLAQPHLQPSTTHCIIP